MRIQSVCIALVAVIALTAGAASAKIQTKAVDYEQDGTKLKGFLAWDDAVEGKRPGVLVVHEWWGLNDYAKKRATMLAEAGYVAFALDMYGDGKTTEHPKEAGEWANAIGSNQEAAGARFNAARDLLAMNEHVAENQIAAIGYCFGGAVVQTMALKGADLRAVASFHGGFPAVEPAENVEASILVCHGIADAMANDEQLTAYKSRLENAGVDFEINLYGHARHSFTNPGADARGIPNLAYNEKADKRSWRAMLGFLEEAFASE